MRNNLKKGGFVIDGKLISWQHIVDFYNFDKRNRIRLAPKLKDKHIYLPPFSSMRVNLVAQVLSHSVAAGISFLVTCKELPEEAIHTAHFVEHFDNLFNTFNSRSLRSSQKLGHAFNDSSGHHAFLRESLIFLDKVKRLDGKELPSIQGWKININELLGLWHYLKSEKNFRFILTNRLNQDCVENLFCIIRGRGGHRDNPDSQQLKGAFKFVVADKLFVQNTGSNCFPDGDKILLDVSSIAMAKCVKPSLGNIKPPPTMDIEMFIQPPLSICEENVAAYLSGYLLRKITVDCKDCSEQLILPHLPSPFDELSVYEFLRNKTYREEGCLIYPTLAMLGFVENLEEIFNATFENIIHMPFILGRLCKSADSKVGFLNCVQESCTLKLQAMIKLYMKMRIHHALKMSNTKIGEDKTVKRNRKMLKLSHL